MEQTKYTDIDILDVLIKVKISVFILFDLDIKLKQLRHLVYFQTKHNYHKLNLFAGIVMNSKVYRVSKILYTPLESLKR